MPNWIPEGRHSVTPRLFVDEPERMVRFLKEAFGATGDFEINRPSEMWIGDSVLMISEVGPRRPTSSSLYVYVEDVDTTYQRGLNAGADSIEEPADMPWGDRRAILRDPFGNDWQIATHKGA